MTRGARRRVERMLDGWVESEERKVEEGWLWKECCGEEVRANQRGGPFLRIGT